MKLNRYQVFGAVGAIVVALLGLLGYVPGLALLGSVREGYIPMAPSTAVSFIVLAGVLLAMALRPASRAKLVLFGALAVLVSYFGAAEVAGHFTGFDLNLEDVMVPRAGLLGEIPIGRMSPATGAGFLLAGLAVLALVMRQSRTHAQATHLGHGGGILGSLVLGISLLFCIAYVLGSPLLYGQGGTVPMALTTALAFFMLGVATVGAAGEDVVPLSLLTGVSRTGVSMSPRKRFLALAFTMVAVCAIVMAVMTVVLYRHEIKEHRGLLQVTAKSQARLIEDVARYDIRMAGMMQEGDMGADASAATLGRIIDAHQRSEWSGETGEFALARRNGDSIEFVTRHRHGGLENPEPVAFDSELAEPMRRALNGLSGTVIGLDYRGETVLAAHEPVAVLDLGIVAKIDMAEIRAPFIRSGLAAAGVALIFVLMGTALFFRIGNPIIARLEEHARDLENEIEERNRAEKMRVELEDQLRQAQKMESIGRLAGGVAHDLNNLLTPIIGYSEMLQQDLGPDDERLESIDEIYHAGIGARDLIRQLLAFSRKQTLEFKTVDINKTISGFMGLLRGSVREDVEIETDLPPGVHKVTADVGQIEQVIMNLAINSNDAMPHGGRLIIKTSNVVLDDLFVTEHPGATPGEFVLLAVIDTGYGMDAMTREHAFEPFYSTKGHQGTGLGLATVYGIVKQHEGYISVDSEIGKGTAVKVYLPVSKTEPAKEAAAEQPVTELKGVETVLLVEDYEPLRILAQTVLRRQGYTVLIAESGPEALALLDSHDGPLHLLLTDVVMPKMSGKELSDLALEKQPGMKVLFMSGYSEEEISHRGVLDEGTAFIQKPFTIEGLAGKVRQVLG